ncbi:MAG TPA: hypothetical protein VG899_00805 [Mycobacteriales bacterium]|nr:hypothetical protein [Mycobacteriales bacterium]HWB66411.1 hypothetical protein [Mycobacteriales bacterium]
MLTLWSTILRVIAAALIGGVVGSGPGVPTLARVPSGGPVSGAVGRDVGDASCASTLGTNAAFGVIATTAGRPYYASPCLAAEYAWASSLAYRPEYYMNLADPGHRSSHWNLGGPKTCLPHAKYNVGCAYDYGFEAAANAWDYVRSIGASGAGRWWLDVEVDNTWGYGAKGVAANIAVIRGALRALRSKPHVAVGIYTETVWWWEITGDTRSFSTIPVWGGGAGSRAHASENCLAHSITGGRALLAQWISRGVDHDLVC